MPVYSPARNSSEDEYQDSDRGLLSEKDFRQFATKQSFVQRHAKLIIVHILLFTFYGLSLLAVSLSARAQALKGPGLVSSPAHSAVEYSLKTFSLEDKFSHDGNAFVGKPSESIDKAWHDLLNVQNIRLPGEYVRQLGREQQSVKLPEGDEYAGVLNVYHQLHCVKRLYQYMYADHYFPNATTDEMTMNRLHNEHCLDFLRESAMCHGDIGLLTFQWTSRSRIPVANATSHECVNWDTLHGWVKEHTVDMMKPGYLTNPFTNELAYPDGKGDKIGAAHGVHDRN